MEFVNGIDMFDYVTKTTFQETDISNLLRQIVVAIAYCHQKKVVHRDIKLENLMICEGKIKVIDFGLAIEIKKDDTYNYDRVGSLAYAAPETYKKKLSNQLYKLDVWSIGVVFYAMVTKVLPFDEATEKCNKYKIYTKNNNKFNVQKGFESIANLMHKMLQPIPSDRITLEDALNDDFLKIQ